MKHHASRNRFLPPAAALVFTCAAMLTASNRAGAADLHWDGDITGGTNGASDFWNTITTNWNPNSDYSGTAAPWTNGDSAFFSGTAGTVTLGEAALSAGTVTFNTAGYTIDSNGNSATWATLAGAGGFTKSGVGNLTLTGASTATGTVTISGGKIILGNNSSLGTTSVTLNGGSLERNVAGAVIANNLSVGAGGGTLLGRQTVDDYTTFSGQLTGSGALTVEGLLRLDNASNTYAGPINIADTASTFFRLSASGVLGAATDITLAGANSRLRLDGGITQTIDSLSGTSGQVFVSKVGALTAARLITGSQNSNSSYAGTFANNDGALTLEKSGSGTLTLNRVGGNAAAITGVEVTNGALTLNGASVAFNAGYFTGTAAITVKSGGTLNVNNTWNIGSSNVVTVDGGAMAFNTGTDGPNYMNNLTVQNGGTVSGPWRAGNTAAASVTSSGNTTNTIAGNVFLVKSGTTVWSLNVADGSAATDLAITGRLVDLGDLGSSPGLQGSSVRKTGAGTVRLSGDNLWDGGLVISQGTVLSGHGKGLGDGATTLGDSGTGAGSPTMLLDVNGAAANLSTATNFTIASITGGTAVLGSTASTPAGARTATFTGSVTLGDDLQLRTGAGDFTKFSGNISGTGNVTIVNGSLTGDTRGNAGNRIIWDGTAKSFNGSLTVQGGTASNLTVFQINSNEMIPNSTDVTLEANSVLRLFSNESIDGLTGSGRVRGVVNNYTLTVGADGASSSFAGIMENDPHDGGSLNLAKTGAGTFNYTGTATHTGTTTVNGGRFNLNGSIASNTTVGNAGTIGILGGDGTLNGNLTLGANGTLLPGQGGTTDRSLAITGNVTTVAGAAVSFTIDGESAHDQLGVGGSIDLANADLAVTFNDATVTLLGPGQGLTFLTSGASFYQLISGTTTNMFANVTDLMSAAELSYFGLSGTQYKTSFGGQDFWVAQGSTYLVAIPEPRAALLGGLGMLALLRRRR